MPPTKQWSPPAWRSLIWGSVLCGCGSQNANSGCAAGRRSWTPRSDDPPCTPGIYVRRVNKWWGRCWIPWWTSASRAGSPSWLGHSPSLPSPAGGGNVYFTMNWFLCKKHISSLIDMVASHLVRRWQSMKYISYLSMTLFSKFFFTRCWILLLECWIVFDVESYPRF